MKRSNTADVIMFFILTIITLGIYPVYFHVSRHNQTQDMLMDIKNKLEFKARD